MSTQRTASLHHWTCSTCPFSTSHPGALGTHSRACERRKRKRDVVADDLARQEALIRSETHDDAGRKLWRTAHNDLCEVCGKEGSLLLCSYCNTSWHLQCTGEQFVEAPEGYWMCGMCVEAEWEGDDVTHHGLPGEDDEECSSNAHLARNSMHIRMDIEFSEMHIRLVSGSSNAHLACIWMQI